MQIRTFLPSDREAVLALVADFYNSPACLHRIPVQNFADAFDEMAADRGLMRGLALVEAGRICCYCQLAFTYSTEAGGPVVLLEELYLAPDCRGRGWGSEVLEFLKREYAGRAARIRLEVAPENPRARQLYEREGFAVLGYTQMILENFAL